METETRQCTLGTKMGLEDFKRDLQPGQVQSDKDITDIKLSKTDWETLLAFHPGTFEAFVIRLNDEEKTKAAIQLLDKAINDNLSSVNISESNIEQYEQTREELVKELTR